MGANRAARNQAIQQAGLGGALQHLAGTGVVDLQPLQYGGNSVAAFDADFAPVAFCRIAGGRQCRQGDLFDNAGALNSVGDGVRCNTEGGHDADKRQQQREQTATQRAAVKQGAKLLR